MSVFSFHFLINFLRPEVLIIDDFDRIPRVNEMLGSIDFLRQRVRLLLVTVNNKDQMDPAVIRAGRFDDVIEVTSVRKTKDLIPELDAVLLAELDEWPIAFVEELRVRLDVLGKDTLEEEIQQLRERVRINSSATARPVRMEEN